MSRLKILPAVNFTYFRPVIHNVEHLPTYRHLVSIS
jgi:hypothetical protein